MKPKTYHQLEGYEKVLVEALLSTDCAVTALNSLYWEGIGKVCWQDTIDIYLDGGDRVERVLSLYYEGGLIERFKQHMEKMIAVADNRQTQARHELVLSATEKLKALQK